MRLLWSRAHGSLLDHATLVLLAAGWVALGVTTLTQGGSRLQEPVWYVWAFANGLLTLWYVAYPRAVSPSTMRLGTTVVLAYAFSRAMVYVSEGIYAPAAVWFLFSALTIHSYKLGRTLRALMEPHRPEDVA